MSPVMLNVLTRHQIIDRIIAKEGARLVGSNSQMTDEYGAGYEDVLNVDYTNDQATSESSRRPPQRSEPSARHHESILAKSDIVDRPAEQIKGERRVRQRNNTRTDLTMSGS